jgi:ABC-type multidrug transport system ATPase subunit
MRLDGVWYRYGRGAWVLREVDVEVAAGQLAVVLGRNGAGKSTLLQILAGVRPPARGAVHDRPAVAGWAPERFPADQPCTVGQYLVSMGRVRGLSAPAAARAADTWLERLGLGAYRAVRLPEVSKGTAQKVGLAQAVLTPPGLLVLDEPWEGLDAATRALVPEIVGEVIAAGGSVVVSDHRGEVARLPGAVHWTVADATVTVARATDGDDGVILEVAVAAAAAADVVAGLRAQGHRVLRVRPSAERAGGGPR